MHKIAIADSVIAQVKAQRGRLSRYDGLIGSQTALVVSTCRTPSWTTRSATRSVRLRATSFPR